MPRFGTRVLISPSQEEVLEAISGWDDLHHGTGIIDETPTSQPAVDAENSSPTSSQERVFDVTGSSLGSGASQEAVEFVSPTRIAALEVIEGEEDSYNEAFESDRSQSPARTVSWSLPAGHPKSPTSSTGLIAVAADEVRKSPFSSKLKVVTEVEASNRPSAVALETAGVTIAIRAELEVDREVRAAEEVAEERCDRREGSVTGRESNGCCGCGGGGGESRTTEPTTVIAQGKAQHIDSIGSRLASPGKSSVPRGCHTFEPFLPGDRFGFGRPSAFMDFRRKDKDSQIQSQPALSGEHRKASGLERESKVQFAGIVLDQIANTVQVNMQVVANMEVLDDDQSGDRFEKRRLRVHNEREVSVEGDVSQSRVSTDELATPVCQGRTELLSGQEQSKEPLLPPSPCNRVTDAAPAACATEGGGQCSPPSPPSRPPRAVQEKLDKLRSLSGTKRPRSVSYDHLVERLRTERAMISATTVLEAVRFRTGERPATTVTAADLLKTALKVGITFPLPLHRHYINDKK